MMDNRILVASALAACACTCDKSPAASGAPAPPPSASAAPVARPSADPIPAELEVPSSWPVASGLRLAILAGQGVGPIRLGATVATIERLMAIPCEYKTETSCRYVGRAIEFNLKNGVTVEMHLHRRDRPTTPDGSVFGVFNGHTPEGVAFFMLQSGVQELLGKPQKTEPVKNANPWGMAEVWYYPGMRLEFDRIANGNLVLGGIVITAPDAKK